MLLYKKMRISEVNKLVKYMKAWGIMIEDLPAFPGALNYSCWKKLIINIAKAKGRIRNKNLDKK